MFRAAIVALSILTIVGGPAAGAPTWLDCHASGPAGDVSFRVAFDESGPQVSALWSAGGGRPTATYFGETGMDTLQQPGVSMTTVEGSMAVLQQDDPYAYRIMIDRTNGSMQFVRYNGGLRISAGACSRSASQGSAF